MQYKKLRSVSGSEETFMKNQYKSSVAYKSRNFSLSSETNQKPQTTNLFTEIRVQNGRFILEMFPKISETFSFLWVMGDFSPNGF